MLNPLEEIISLLRGYFACPIISTLGKEGVLDVMLQKEDGFVCEDFPKVTNQEFFRSVLAYLLNLGLLKKNGQNRNVVTEMGKKVFKRYGSYCLLHSYGNFLNELDNILFDPDYKTLPKCNRLINIIGSGQANAKKYFPVAFEILSKYQINSLADIGCGDGIFLDNVLGIFPSVSVLGVDISEVSVAVTERKLKQKYPQAQIKTFLSNGADIEKWGALFGKDKKQQEGLSVITMWYLIHEISKHDKNIVIDFLKTIYKTLPKTHLIIGEIVEVPVETLVQNRFSSVIPEYLFFHQISGQGVLPWADYQEILRNIPYKLESEKLFNMVTDGKQDVPSSFIWHLVPQ